MPNLNTTNYLAILLIVALLLLLPHLSLLPVNVMEARNFITAREMATDGNWILTTINGQPRYEKPPLPTWITAVSGLAFGFNSLFGMRLPVVLVTLLLVVFVYRFSLKLELPNVQAFRNGLILITSFYIYFSGRDNQWDMYCHSFMMVSLYCLWNIFRRNGSAITNGIIGGLFLGFSILSKGPVSLYALLLPFIIAYGIVYRYNFKNTGQFILPIALYCVAGLVTGLSWPLYIRFADPATLAEISSREAGRWASYNTRPIYYYWSFFTQSGLWTLPALAALMYPYMKKRVSNLQAYRFTFFWTIGSVILLSLIPEKKARYLLPVLIPMALNTGFYIEYLWNSFSRASKKEKLFVYFTFGLVAIIGISFPIAQYFVVKENRNDVFTWMVIASTALFITGSFIAVSLYRNNFKNSFYGAVALQVLIVITAFPLAKSFLYHDTANSVARVKALAAAEKIKVYEFSGTAPEIIWEYGQKIPKYTIANSGHKFGLLAAPTEYNKVKNALKGYAIEKKGGIDLNTVPKGKKSHKERLETNFYIVTLN